MPKVPSAIHFAVVTTFKICPAKLKDKGSNGFKCLFLDTKILMGMDGWISSRLSGKNLCFFRMSLSSFGVNPRLGRGITWTTKSEISEATKHKVGLDLTKGNFWMCPTRRRELKTMRGVTRASALSYA
jgi:hypothetical protein